MSHSILAAIWKSSIEAPGPGVPVARGVAMGLAAAGILGWSAPAHAIACGETVGPSEELQVLNENLECEESPALVIEGPVVVDLRGHTIACALTESDEAPDGVMTGTGIEVQNSFAYIRRGRIKNCVIGVLVEGNDEGDGSHRLERLTVTSSPGVGGDSPRGFRVESDHNVFVHNVVKKYPGEGFRLDDANFNVLKENKVLENGDHGYRVSGGQNNLFLRNKAINNEGEGFRSQDDNNRFVRNTASGNGDDGFRIRAAENLVVGNIAKGNGLVPCDEADANAGIAITNNGSKNRIIGNKLSHNCVGIGIEAAEGDVSLDNRILGNYSRRNTLVDMADGNVDCDDNTWFRNIFRTSVAGDLDESPPCIR
jgi:parallel beta-helix repeat protein